MDSLGFLKTILRLVIISLVFNVINIVGQGATSVSQGPVWDPSLRANCALFRNDTTAQEYGTLWPENLNSVYCCQDGTPFLMNISQYRYNPQKGNIRPVPYNDLRIVDKFTPYWQHCWLFFQLDQTALVLTPAQCAYTDIQTIYGRRFRRRVLARDGFARSALPFIITLEIAVVLCIVARILCVVRDYTTRHRYHWRMVLKEWWGIYRKYLILDWLDLLLLGFNGNGLVEAMGHSDPREYTSILLYNIAVFYSWVTLITWVSYLLLQVAVWTSAEDRVRISANLSSTGGAAPPPEARGEDDLIVWLRKGAVDWRWQRFGYQFFTLLFLQVYCLIPGDTTMAANIVIPIILAAIIWSGLLVISTGATGAATIFRFYASAHQRRARTGYGAGPATK